MTAQGNSTTDPAAAPATPLPSDALQLFRRELAAYLRELPRLVEEGQSGRHVLVKGDEVLSLWDTQADALQAGRQLFGLDPIFVKSVDPRDRERLAALATAEGSACPG